MGAVGGLLGLNGGAGGSGYSAPTEGVTVAQEREAAQRQLGQQQNFANALNPYALQAAQSQQALLQQLQQGAQGKGPNPALAQLAQTTGQNTANQAALMAGQRGAGSNPALMARQAAMQGASNQQNAIGQAATLSAQQQLAQQQALAAQQAQMVGQGQSSLANAQNAANQIYSTGSGLQSNINQGNAALAGGVQQMQGQVLGGLMQGLSSGAGAAAKAEGGMIKKAEGGPVETTYNPATIADVSAIAKASPDSSNLYKGASSFGKYLMSPASQAPATSTTDNGYFKGRTATQEFAEGGKVPVLLSPGEKVLSPEKAKAAANGKASPMAEGKKVPGKPKVGGAKNDYANDTHKDALEPGSVVLPRSVTQSKDAEKKAIAFIQAVMAKHGGLK